MNWGYHAPGEQFPVDLGDERYPLQLYFRLVQGVPIAGKDIVEVSCGRGGGLAALHARLGPASAVGLDLSPGNVRQCRQTFAKRVGLRFVQGDAQALPLGDATADVVLSVEASHCYPQQDRFVCEAARVLRPGGMLLWTDFRDLAEMPEVHRDIGSDFEIEHVARINEQVLAAIALDGARRNALVSRAASGPLAKALRHFAAVDEHGSVARSLRAGGSHYFLLQLRRR